MALAEAHAAGSLNWLALAMDGLALFLAFTRKDPAAISGRAKLDFSVLATIDRAGAEPDGYFLMV